MKDNLPFAAVTLSPAIDVTLAFGKFPEPGDVLKGFGEVETPGGKGLNSARWLALRGHPVTASGIIGVSNLEPLEAMMAEYGIEDAFIRVPGPNRRNVMYCSPGGMFKVNRPAFPNLRDQDWSVARVLEHFAADDTINQLRWQPLGAVRDHIDAARWRQVKARVRRAREQVADAAVDILRADLDDAGGRLRQPGDDAGDEISSCLMHGNPSSCAVSG